MLFMSEPRAIGWMGVASFEINHLTANTVFIACWCESRLLARCFSGSTVLIACLECVDAHEYFEQVSRSNWAWEGGGSARIHRARGPCSPPGHARCAHAGFANSDRASGPPWWRVRR